MMILGVDTATSNASAALVADGKLVAEELHSPSSVGAGSSSPARSNHATIVLPLIERLFHRTNTSLQDISALAVSIGPGSFTGLRIGLSTIKGLAYGWDIPVVAVPTLLATAARVDEPGLVCPCLDARKREVYAAVFMKTAEKLERLTPDEVSPPEKIIERVLSLYPQSPCFFIGDGANAYRTLIVGTLGDRAVLVLNEGSPSVACAVARLAAERVRKGEFDPVGPLVPLYLRPSEAELKRL